MVSESSYEHNFVYIWLNITPHIKRQAQIMKMTFSIHDFLSKHIIQVRGIDHQLREKIVLISIFTWSSFYSPSVINVE